MPSASTIWSNRCRVCRKGDLTALEKEHRVHEYCRSVLGSAWRLTKKSS